MKLLEVLMLPGSAHQIIVYGVDKLKINELSGTDTPALRKKIFEQIVTGLQGPKDITFRGCSYGDFFVAANGQQ